MNKSHFVKNTIVSLKHNYERLITLRWIIFFLSIGAILLYWGDHQSFSFYIISALLLSIFIINSLLLSFFNTRLTNWKHYQELLDIEKYRSDLEWEKLPKYRSPDLSHEEFDLITAADLHLIGEHSALHLMDSCITDYGQKVLVHSLLTEESKEFNQARQNKVKELLPLRIFRMKFKLLGKLHARELLNKEIILSTFNSVLFKKKFFFIFAVLIIVQLMNMGLLAGFLLGEIKPYFLLSIPIIYLLYQLLKMQSDNAFEVGLKLQTSLERLLPLFKLVEKLAVTKEDALYAEFSIFQNSPPSELLKKINRVVSLLSVRANPLLGMLLNFLFPWDFGLLIVLGSLKDKHSQQLKLWMDSLGRLEALVSISDYSDIIGGKFPQLLSPDSPLYLKASHLVHPLLEKGKRVPNSYLAEKSSPIAVITGSNMAGKSTFLRTIGLNICLAKAGATVLADEFSVQNLSVKSLIKAQDFLEKEMSLFYFEVRRLKDILLKARKSSDEFPFFFLIDEIYRGTNNQERYQGAVAYLEVISSLPHCSGLLTTHDINIAKKLEANSLVRQFHFQEKFRDGKLSYDYKINTGICETTNALRIMEKEGLPV
jgi:hypothetical protein